MEVQRLTVFNVQAGHVEITQITQQEYNVHEINSIKKRYEEARSKSKAPTFALT